MKLHFSKSLFGYNPSEVEKAINELEDEIKGLTTEKRDLERLNARQQFDIEDLEMRLSVQKEIKSLRRGKV